MSRRESLYHKVPGYRVALEPSDALVRVTLGGRTLAESRRTLVVRETKHAAVRYFPRQDVHFDLLEPTSFETFCPFKGSASYWSARVGERLEENVAWSYEDPFDEVVGLKDYVSFYVDRVDWDGDADASAP